MLDQPTPAATPTDANASGAGISRRMLRAEGVAGKMAREGELATLLGALAQSIDLLIILERLPRWPLFSLWPPWPPWPPYPLRSNHVPDARIDSREPTRLHIGAIFLGRLRRASLRSPKSPNFALLRRN
jgi:hypothetical protein